MVVSQEQVSHVLQYKRNSRKNRSSTPSSFSERCVFILMIQVILISTPSTWNCLSRTTKFFGKFCPKIGTF